MTAETLIVASIVLTATVLMGRRLFVSVRKLQKAGQGEGPSCDGCAGGCGKPQAGRLNVIEAGDCSDRRS